MNRSDRKVRIEIRPVLGTSPTQFTRLFCIKYVIPVVNVWASRYLRLHNAAKNRIDRYWKEKSDLRSLRRRRQEILSALGQGYRLKLEDFGLQDERLAEVKEILKSQRELIIADIDQDGFVTSRFGPVDSLPIVDHDEFIDRGRFQLHVVAIDGYVGIKKSYKGFLRPFLREFQALCRLGSARCNVPALLDVDFDELVIVLSYIPGSILREELAKRGAVLRDRDVARRPDLLALPLEERVTWVIDEGLRYLHETVSRGFVDKLFEELQKVHAARFIWGDIKHGNILIQANTGEPFLIDFDASAYYPELPQGLFREMRDQDIDKFNRHFETDKLTFARLAGRIREFEQRGPIASPVYFGAGLTMGDVSSNAAGYGYWHTVLKNHVPDLAGKRVMDIGADNGYECIQMLQRGASEAIAVAFTDAALDQASFVREAFEYLDNRKYALDCVLGSPQAVRELPAADFIFARLPALRHVEKSCDAIARFVAGKTDGCILRLDADAGREPTAAGPDAGETLAEEFRNAGFSKARLVQGGREAGNRLLVASKR